MSNLDITLPTQDQIRYSKVFKEYGTKCLATDFALLSGIYVNNYDFLDKQGFGPLVSWWVIPDTPKVFNTIVTYVYSSGYFDTVSGHNRLTGGRPAVKYSDIAPYISKARQIEGSNITEVEFGEYPQTVADENLNHKLESLFLLNILKSVNRFYTTDSCDYCGTDIGFSPTLQCVYEYDGEKYTRFRATSNSLGNSLSNGIFPSFGNFYWVKVEPIKWLIDSEQDLAVSEKVLFSNVQFLSPNTVYNGNFYQTGIKKFIDGCFAKEITSGLNFQVSQKKVSEKPARKTNPYGFKLDEVTEEDEINGYVESGIAVFLHGPSSEGKSARVKQIDPTCEVIYLRNATPESLNGKSVYNQNTGEMIDVKPTWLQKVEEKCKKEPDRLHVVFLDEITNALPSIQGIAFNIVLDKEVNGKWKLPENARIVAAGNDVKDSLAANELAEPLFNRFAHVYIKTTTDKWLKWASENNIHPAIYSYIAYKNGKTLRSEYDGKKPNADPRKWEMASKMLYQTGNPEMLRSLVGEDITREFVEFCSQRVITLEDVLNGEYTDEDVENLNTAERYATASGLTQASVEDIEKVKEFVSKLGAEFVSIFYVLWAHGDEERLERLAEIKDPQELIKELKKDE